MLGKEREGRSKKLEGKSGETKATTFDLEQLYEQKLIRPRKPSNEIELPFFIGLDSKSVLNKPITATLQDKGTDVGPFDTRHSYAYLNPIRSPTFQNYDLPNSEERKLKRSRDQPGM